MGFQIDPRRFADRVGSWLQHEGPESDVVISCRTRLARNVSGYRFVSRLEPEPARELCRRVGEILVSERIDGETYLVHMDEVPTLVRLLLRERHLVSRDLAPSEAGDELRPGRAVAFGENETSSVMINEEDHLRLQGMAAGFDLQSAWRRAYDLDRRLEQIGYSCDPELGYLTGCPTNVGTGMRASVMLHLPGLNLVKSELRKVFNAAERTNLAVRGMYGEGSRAAGDFYQVSNQITLGCTEESLIGELESLVPAIVSFERKVRQALLEEQEAAVKDRVSRSLGMLRSVRSVTTEVALMHLSNVRLGACLGLAPGFSPHELSRLAIQLQKAHVQALSGQNVSGALVEPTERDRLRASFLRKRFAEPASG